MTDIARSMALTLVESMISDGTRLVALLNSRAGEATALVALNALLDVREIVIRSEGPKLA